MNSVVKTLSSAAMVIGFMVSGVVMAETTAPATTPAKPQISAAIAPTAQPVQQHQASVAKDEVKAIKEVKREAAKKNATEVKAAATAPVVTDKVAMTTAVVSKPAEPAKVK